MEIQNRIRLYSTILAFLRCQMNMRRSVELFADGLQNEPGKEELSRAAKNIGWRLAKGTPLKSAVFESLENTLSPEEWIILDSFGSQADDEITFQAIVDALTRQSSIGPHANKHG